MEDEPNESCGRTNNCSSSAKERLRLIKEERRKQHEERLGRGSLFPAGLAEESDTIKRFSKYRRSGSDRAVRKAANLESSLVQSSDGDNSTESVSKTEIFPGPDPSREDLWNVSPVYVPGSRDSEDPVSMAAEFSSNPFKSSLDGSYNDGLTISLAPSPMLTASLSLDQTKGVLKKPAIPAILRSATEPGPGPTFSSEDNENYYVMVKKPSILKKKDDSSNPVTPSSSSSGGGGQSASVSFGLPVTTNMLSRTKSIDSNLSGDTETGYWSGGENVGGILKSRRCPSDGDSGDQSSIMKSRRSSFGSSVASSSNSGSEGGLQSILKRKLSYDSSYIMKEASGGNEYSFSTHSLPACGCLSPEPKPILKKKSNSEDLDEQVEPKPILKHRNSRSSERQSEVIIEPEKTIKPCLKKSSSKSVDEGFSSACVNFSPSFPLSVSPVSGSDGISNSRSILKRSGSGGGILKNAWRESASTSTSSSSSELDNSRPGQVGEDYSFLLHSSAPPSSSQSQGLERARRYFRSEGDINNEDGPSSDCIIDSRAQSAVPPGSSATSSFDAPAALLVENGFVSNLLHRPSRNNYDEDGGDDDDDPQEDFLGEEGEGKEASEKVSRSNSSRERNSSTRSSLPVTSSFDSLEATTTEQDYFFAARKKLNNVKKTVSPPPPSSSVPVVRRSVDDVIVPESTLLYKRRTSLGSSYPASSNSSISDYSSFLNNLASSAGVTVSTDSYERSLEEVEDEPLKGKDISGTRIKKGRNAVSTNNYYEWCNETGKRGLSSDSSQIRRNNLPVAAITTTTTTTTTTTVDDGEDLSVAQRRSLFIQLENDEPKGKSVKHVVETEGDLVTSASSSSSSSRSKRHTTQPITPNEVEKAAANFIVQNVTLAATTTVNERTKNNPAHHTLHSKDSYCLLESHNNNNKLSDFHTRHFEGSCTTMESLGQEEEEGKGEEYFVDDSAFPLTSKPPTGAGGLKKTRTQESFVARLARIHNERARVEVTKSLPFTSTLPRTTTRLIPRDTLSRVSPAVAVPAVMVPLISITAATATTHEEDDDEPVGSSGPKSLKDRIRMFDSLASTIQSEYKAAKKKSVTSKRFLTQPVSMTSDQLEQFPRPSKDKFNYEIGALPSLPLSYSYDDDDDDDEEEVEDNVRRDTTAATARSVAATTGRRTVRSKEGQIEDELSECSSQSLGGIPTTTSSAQHSSHSDSGEDKDKSDRCSQDEEEDEESTSPPLQGSSNSVRSHCPEEEREDSEGEMPEKIQSDDSAGSSNDEASTDLYVDTSCVKRRLNKSKDGSSTDNSMMMSPESEVNLFGKGSNNKVNRNSIADKIAALQTNGEISWKKRVIKINPEYPDKAKPTLTDQNDNVEIRKNNVVELRKNNRDTSVIANRLSQLESSQERWKARVGENDANIFTVQGRLERAGKITKGTTSLDGPGSPPKESKVKSLGAKVIAPIRFKTNSKDGGSSPSSSPKEEIPPKVKQTTEPVEIIGAKTTRKQYSRSDTASSGEGSEEEKIVVCSVVENDNETFSRFFCPISESGSRKQQQQPGGRQSTARLANVQIDESSFKAIQSESGKLGGLRKNVKVPRNHNSTKNPVRSLALRLQKQSYTELSPQVREKEMKKRMQIDNLTKNAPLSVEALAGLASKEDFTAVKLKKANGNEQRAKDFPHPMLILIKGKRQVQTRVVAPEVTSLSSGDNYILVTANKVYQFIGEYSNRLERAKIADVVSHIVQKKDLGCRIGSMTEVGTLEEPLICGRDQSEFFRLLGSGGVESVPDSADDLGDESDEAYESGIVSTNRVFEVDQVKGELVPLLDGSGGGWGAQPRFSLLQDDKVLVFDFITELYVWSASKADPELKKTAYRLAKEMFEGEYDEPDCEDKRLSRPFEGSQRPNWCFLKKINQHMEPILFIEKFFDWPDDSGRLIKVQQLKKNSDSSLKEANYNFNACDVEEMLKCFEQVPEPELELEGFNVGRGTEVRNYEDRRTFQITTLNVKAWNISEFSKCDVDSSALGQFYSEEAYVIRWQFSVSQIGRDLKGNISKHSGVLGRERCTYFFWQGKNSRITEQGTSALMTVELDSEKGPQVRVEQGREPPAFLNLFQGLMFVHLESREAPMKDMKLYVAMGAAESEGHFIEVACQASSFRSLGSFILVDCVKGRVYLWHGKLSDSVSRKIAAHGAAAIVDSPQRYINVHGSFRLIEMEEGGESALFFNCLGGLNAKKFLTEYCSLRDQRLEQYAETKIYMFSSIQGAFEANPVLSIKRKADSPEAFPILQEELYSAQQPRLFLISRGPETWLWQGWQPLGDEENENTATGSGEIRWAAERKAALQTAIGFCEATQTKGLLITAGLEPTRFTNIFSYWNVVDEAREANMCEGRTVGLTIPVEEELQKFMRPRIYTLEELQERPEGVDQSKLETYLCDEEFESLLKMDREEFNKLQAWKQNELKKAVGLF